MQDLHTPADAIREQVQFYFQSANLLTDPHMLRELEKNRAWINVAYFLNCAKIRELFCKLNVDIKQRRRKLLKILSQSTVLKVSHGRVKRKNKFRPKMESKKLIYIQFNRQSQDKQIKQEIVNFSTQNSMSVSLKNGESWMFLVPSCKQEELCSFIRQNCGKMGIEKVLNGQQWQEQERKYEQLVRAIKKCRKQAEKVEQKQQNRMSDS